MSRVALFSRFNCRKILGTTVVLGVAVLFLLTLSGAWVANGGDVRGRERTPLYLVTQPAHNPERLTLIADANRVVGWLSGTTDHSGADVTITVDKKTETVRIDANNTFAWPYKVSKTTRAEFAVGKHTQTLALTPREQLAPSVYFVADRSVYRPGQAFHFAGFLRQLDERDEFMPLASRAVEVQLRRIGSGENADARKTTLTNRWSLTSDDSGRISGDYVFADTDPLGDYELSIPGFLGSSRFSLAEYRKTKLNLRISGERVGTRLRLTFHAVDFMGKPLAAEKVQFTAQIVRSPKLRPTGTLQGKEFVHAPTNRSASLHLDDLGTEDQLLAQVDPDFAPLVVADDPKQRLVEAQVQADLALGGKSAGEYILEIPKSCQEPGHVVIVHGIVTDTSGREQPKTQTIDLKYLSEQLELSLPRRTFAPNELIEVSVKSSDGRIQGNGVLLAMRLLPAPRAADNAPQGRVHLGQLGQIGHQPMGNGRQRDGTPVPGQWQTFESSDHERRRLVTAVPFKGETGRVKLNEPGPYMLVAVIERPDGSKLQQEIGCVVESPNQGPSLTLQLDRANYKSGDSLSGAIHSRFANAVVLLTIRDSTGLRLWKRYKLAKGMAEINEPLPLGLRYGCAVTVQYADSEAPAGAVHFASKLLHVEPADRTLTIETRMEKVYRPGDTVKVDVQVNRKEPVDLVVSVSDMSLLSIKPSQAIDIRNFYLADERTFENNARDLLQRRLAGITIDMVLDRAERLLLQLSGKEHEKRRATLISLLESAKTHRYTTKDIATLLTLAGVKVKTNPLELGHINSRNSLETNKAFLLALLDVETNGWRLHCSFLHDTFYLTEYHPTQLPNPWQRKPAVAPVPAAPLGQFGQLGAVGQIGALGQIGQLGQLGQLGQIGQLGAMGGMPNSRLLPPAPAPVNRPGALDTTGADAVQPGSFIRQDFSDSAYWNARVRTDGEGKAHVEFKVPDSYTNWQVTVVAVSRNMHVGQNKTAFSVAKPIMVSPIVPRICTEGDKVQVGANIHNRTQKRQTLRLQLKVDNGKVLGDAELTRTLDAGASDIVYWYFQAGRAGFTDVLMSGTCADGADGALKRLPVVCASAEEIVTRAGYCNDPIVLDLPKGVDPKAAALELRLAPTIAADLVDTLDYLVEYPYGCVEQTMSRFLPAIKVAQILKQLKIEHPGLEQKLPRCVEGGIKRLLELQQPDGGWGWIGTSQTHEMMTPYALFGLLQAEKAGYTIGSPDAIERGLNRLRSFINNRGQLSDWVYCVYVYAHRHPVAPEWWQVLDENREKLSDYALALALELAVQHNQPQRARDFADRLTKRANSTDGLVNWRTAGFSRWGDDPHEITAVAFKALVAYDARHPLIPGVLAYFNITKNGNRWNSTKDTSLIVQALAFYLEKERFDPTKARTPLAFRCNDGPVIRVSFDNLSAMQKVRIPAEQVKAGRNTITFVDAAPWVLYRLVLRHWSAEREIGARQHGIAVTRDYFLLDAKGKRVKKLQSGEAILRGSFVESVVHGKCLTPHTKYVLVENPRPCPCEFLPDDDRRFTRQSTAHVLREERQTHLAWHHEETTGGIEDVCVLHAELAGDYLIPPARVELMYNTETHGHSGTFRLRVVER